MEAMNDDVPTIRRAIAALSPSKTQRRYPEALSRRIAALARSHPGRDPSSLARRLDMAPQTLARIVASAPPVVVPVRVVGERAAACEGVVVRGPRGVVVEGLDVAGVAELLRALS